MGNTTEAIDKISTSGIEIKLETAEELFAIVKGWFENTMAVLNHMAELPDGTAMEDDEGNSVVITGEYLEGFKAGIDLALIQLGNSPFRFNTAAEIPLVKDDT